ncbi:MAG TPA: hypothetical protein ENF75_04430 [Acidilobales archaeon]|nr:hypothetical protein [Acidilobales archaeon]
MRLCCLGDIHYYGSKKELSFLAEGIRDECGNADVLVLTGDLTADGDLGRLNEVLEVIKGVYERPVLIVPGNHDLYLIHSELWSHRLNSLLKLSLFNNLVERYGFIPLMKRPYVVSDVGFVGSIGWYDYSFAPEWLNLPIDAYREKAFGLSIWADREFVKLPMGDEEFTLMLLEKFEDNIRKIYNKVSKVVVVLHHLPFKELVVYKLRPEWDYFSTFMGSEAFGQVIRKYSKIKLVLHGHQHDGVETMRCKDVDGVKCCNCASPIPMTVKV